MQTGKTLAVALIFGLFSFAGYAQAQSPAATAGNPRGDGNILQEYDRAVDQVAERAMQSVVEIDVTGYGVPEGESHGSSQNLERQRSIGSGVIVDPNGYIVTNNHVVNGALRIRVTLAPATVELAMGRTKLSNPQRVYEAKLIGTNRYADLAVIKIEDTGLPFIPLPQAYNVRLGQTVITIGAPEGLDHTVTKGIVSAVGRQPDADRSMVYVQTDAPINPGNSGGPLIDRDGNLVGINTFIVTSGGGSEGLGFAIPEPIVRFVYTELRAHGIVPVITIGAHAQAITPPLAAGLKLPQNWGVIVSDVDPGGPASEGGLKPGDIVKAIDGFPIDSLPKYTALLYVHKRGTPLRMQVLRGGNPVALSINPAPSLPVIDNLTDLIRPSQDLIAPLGIFATGLNALLANMLPDSRSKTGVLVIGLLGGEPAVLADLSVGDVIVSINGKPLSTADELRQELDRYKPGDPVVLEVERQSVMQYVAFEME